MFSFEHSRSLKLRKHEGPEFLLMDPPSKLHEMVQYATPAPIGLVLPRVQGETFPSNFLELATLTNEFLVSGRALPCPHL